MKSLQVIHTQEHKAAEDRFRQQSRGGVGIGSRKNHRVLFIAPPGPGSQARHPLLVLCPARHGRLGHASKSEEIMYENAARLFYSSLCVLCELCALCGENRKAQSIA
jgi:hypothetical protein